MAGTKEQPLMRKDKGGTAIQALGLDCASTVSVNITDGTATPLSIPAGTQMVEVSALIPLYIDFDGTADANSHVFPSGTATYKILDGQTSLSVMRIVGTDVGPVTLTPLA